MHYTGHVVANLTGPNGQRMRCQFQLLRAGDGMKGGGQSDLRERGALERICEGPASMDHARADRLRVPVSASL